MIFERFVGAADKTIDLTTKDRMTRMLAKTIIRVGILVFTIGVFLVLALLGAIAIGIVAGAWQLLNLIWST